MKGKCTFGPDDECGPMAARRRWKLFLNVLISEDGMLLSRYMVADRIEQVGRKFTATGPEHRGEEGIQTRRRGCMQ